MEQSEHLLSQDPHPHPHDTYIVGKKKVKLNWHIKIRSIFWNQKTISLQKKNRKLFGPWKPSHALRALARPGSKVLSKNMAARLNDKGAGNQESMGFLNWIWSLHLKVFTWKISSLLWREIFCLAKIHVPRPEPSLSGVFFPREQLLVSGLFGSNTNPGFSPTVTGWSQESTEAYPYWDSPRFSLWQSLWQSLCVFLCLTFQKVAYHTETEAETAWSLYLLYLYIYYLFWWRIQLPSQATPPKSTWSAKTAAFTWVSGECSTLTWWYPHLMDGSKKEKLRKPDFGITLPGHSLFLCKFYV